jgi:UDP-N-acetylglucosamine transferase subunit ALG13
MLYKQIESERKMFKESWIQNRIDNFQEQIALALYKLQYVTC